MCLCGFFSLFVRAEEEEKNHEGHEKHEEGLTTNRHELVV
jgi:hypothetical protein